MAGNFPESDAARLGYILSHQWETRQYLDMTLLRDADLEKSAEEQRRYGGSFWFWNKSAEFNFCERYLTLPLLRKILKTTTAVSKYCDYQHSATGQPGRPMASRLLE